MKIIHGDDQVSSRRVFLDIKDKAAKTGKNVVTYDGSKMSLADLTLGLGSSSFFGQKQAIFIENFYSRRPGNEKKAIIQYLNSNQDLDIYIWESKNQSLQLKSFTPLSIQKFDFPKTVFNFLESFTINDFHKSIPHNPPEQILSLLAAQIHKLILVKSGHGNFPPWQQSKLARQAQKYSLEKLISCHRSLVDIDYGQKNSISPMDLTAALELWLVSL